MTTQRRVLVLAHTGRREAVALAAEMLRRLLAAGLHPVMLVDEATDVRALGGQLDAFETVDSPADACDGVELVIVLGGDGTILRALRLYAGEGVPVFAVNYGTMGFLAAVEREEAEQGIRRAFAGEFDVVGLPGLEVRWDGEAVVGLNDISFTRRPHGRVAELTYRIAGQEVGHVRCDGLVAATPAGSTGYNLANSGPILAWGVEGYVVSYIAPHSLTARALVVAPGDVLQVANAAGRDAVDVAVDGAPVGALEPEEEVEIRFRDGVGRLAQLPGTSFYGRIREKFGHLAV